MIHMVEMYFIIMVSSFFGGDPFKISVQVVILPHSVQGVLLLTSHKHHIKSPSREGW